MLSYRLVAGQAVRHLLILVKTARSHSFVPEMKNRLYAFAAACTLAASTLVISSCKKSDDATPATNFSIITTGTWRVSELNLNGQNINAAAWQACRQDNVWTFKKDSTYVTTEGATTCTAGDTSKLFESGTYRLIAGQTKAIRKVLYSSVGFTGQVDTLLIGTPSAAGFTLSKGAGTALSPATKYVFVKN